MIVKFRYFESVGKSWNELFEEAAEFASMVGRENLISISHSHGGATDWSGVGGVGVITVWYWEQEI